MNFWRCFCSDASELPQTEKTNPQRRCGGGNPKQITAGARLGPLSPPRRSGCQPEAWRGGGERELGERSTRSARPAGRGWPGIPRDRGAHGGRVCTAKGASGGLHDVASIRAAEGRPERLATAPRNNPARADGATSALGDSAHTAIAQPSPKSRWRDGSGLCIPTLRLLAQTAPPRAPEIPLPAPAIPLPVRKGYYLSVTLNEFRVESKAFSKKYNIYAKDIFSAYSNRKSL